MRALFGLLFAASLAAQPYGTDIIAAAITGQNPIYRIRPNGSLVTITATLRTYANMVAMAPNNQDIVLGFPANPPELVIMDGRTGALLQTIYSGPPIAYVDYFNPTGNGDYLVAANTAILIVRGDGSSVKTLRAGSPFRNLQGICQDLRTGGAGVGDISTRSVYLVAPDGTIVWTAADPGLVPFSLTQDHRDGSFIAGTGGTGRVYRILPNGSVQTITARARTNANAICFDRWFGTGEIVVGSNPVVRMDLRGQVYTTYPTPFFANTGMCFDQGRNLVAQRLSGRNHFRLDLHVPTQAGRPYVIGLSLTGFTPGIPYGLRTIPLVVDDALILSVQGLLAPFLQGNLGTLLATGRASAVLDLRAFGGALQGVRVWAAAITLDPAAPGGVGVITKPLVLVLE